MSIDESLAKRKLELEQPPLPFVHPPAPDHSQLIKDVENAIYAQHQNLITEFKGEAKRSEAALIDRLNEWETAFNRNQEAWAAESRSMAEKTLKAALATAQESAQAVIRKEAQDWLHETRKVLHENGFGPEMMDGAHSPMFLGDDGRRPSWRAQIISWAMWLALIVGVVMVVLLTQKVLHLFG